MVRGTSGKDAWGSSLLQKLISQASLKPGFLKLGFLILELVLGIALIILLVSLTVGLPLLMDRMILKSAVATVASVITHAQSLACITGEQVDIHFDEHGNTYSCADTVYMLPRGVRFGIVPGIKGPPGKPEHDLGRAITFEDNRLVITPQGVVRAGTVYIIDDKKRFIYALTIAVGVFSCPRTYYAGTDGTPWSIG